MRIAVEVPHTGWQNGDLKKATIEWQIDFYGSLHTGLGVTRNPDFNPLPPRVNNITGVDPPPSKYYVILYNTI